MEEQTFEERFNKEMERVLTDKEYAEYKWHYGMVKIFFRQEIAHVIEESEQVAIYGASDKYRATIHEDFDRLRAEYGITK